MRRGICFLLVFFTENGPLASLRMAGKDFFNALLEGRIFSCDITVVPFRGFKLLKFVR